MAHSKNSKKTTMSVIVPIDYPVKGAEFKREITAFFQYIVNEDFALVQDYEKFEKIKELLSKW